MSSKISGLLIFFSTAPLYSGDTLYHSELSRPQNKFILSSSLVLCPKAGPMAPNSPQTASIFPQDSASPQLITHSHIGRSSGFIISALPEGRYAPNNHNPIQYCSLFPTSSTTSSLLPVPYLSWGECFLRWVPSSFLKFLHLVAFYDTQEY